MAEEIELRHLRDKNGKKIAPFSPEAAIYDEKGMRLSDKLKGLNLNNIRDAQDEALSAIDEKENEAIGNFSSQRVIPDMLSPEVMALIETSGGGTINNMPDGEDITSKDIAGGKSVMQLADRPYNPSAFSGKGYTILRKNVSALSRGGSSNILTQGMISQPNTVYIIRYDFDLSGETINIPEGCTLRFDGGSFKNGIVKGNNTLIEANEYNYIFNNVQLKGQYTNSYASVCWFGAINSLKDGVLNQTGCTNAINLALSSDFNAIKFPRGYWFIDNTIVLNRRIDILLDGEMSVVPLNNRTDKHISSDAVLYTNKNISIIEVNYTENRLQRFELIGGALDVSLAEEYTSPVVHVSTKTSKLWGVNIVTSILDRTLRGTGIGVYIDGDYQERCTGYATYITLRSNIYNFAIGCKVSLRSGNNAWITDFTENSDIVSCKQAVYIENIDTVRIIGRYQPTFYYDSKNNGAAAVYINAKWVNIEAKIWDVGLPNDDSTKWVNQYAIELQKDCKYITFIGAAYRYVRMNQVNDFSNIVGALSKYNDYNRSSYNTGGYNELDNWFIKRPQFTATYESNCSIEYFDNLFLPNASQQMYVRTEGVSSPYVKIIITINEPERLTVLLMGILLDIRENGTFTKANLKLYRNDLEEPEQDLTININTFTTSRIAPVYFMGMEDRWTERDSKIEITLSDYVGTISPAIYSIFGKVRKKAVSFLTYGGGDLNGELDITATGIIKKENKPLITNEIVQSPEDLTNDYADTAMFDYRGFIGTIAMKTRNYWGFIYPRNIKYRKIGKSLGRPVITANNTISEYLDYYNTETHMMEYATGEDNNWYNAMGDPVSAKYSGTFAQKPTNVKIGFSYFCTDRKTTEGNRMGIMIYHSGENAWVDALGRIVE